MNRWSAASTVWCMSTEMGWFNRSKDTQLGYIEFTRTPLRPTIKLTRTISWRLWKNIHQLITLMNWYLFCVSRNVNKINTSLWNIPGLPWIRKGWQDSKCAVVLDQIYSEFILQHAMLIQQYIWQYKTICKNHLAYNRKALLDDSKTCHWHCRESVSYVTDSDTPGKVSVMSLILPIVCQLWHWYCPKCDSYVTDIAWSVPVM